MNKFVGAISWPYFDGCNVVFLFVCLAQTSDRKIFFNTLRAAVGLLIA